MKKLLTEKQLCEALAVGRVFIYQYRKEGMPFIRLGVKNIRYEFDDVLRWLEDYGKVI